MPAPSHNVTHTAATFETNSNDVPNSSSQRRKQTRMKVARKNYEYAIKQSCLELEEIAQAKRFKDLPKWVSGEREPTFLQLYELADRTKTPFGDFFASNPPPLPESTGIKDFRIRKDQGFSRKVREIREVVDTCQYRQDWLSQYRQDIGYNRIDWVGSYSISDDPKEVALYLNQIIRRPENIKDKRAMLKTLAELIEGLGVMVSISSTVGTYTRRKLQASWLGGFSLSDPFAPLIFINGSDYDSAKVFTIIHELAHLFLDDTGIDSPNIRQSNDPTEVWCNEVAGNYLVPADLLLRQIGKDLVTHEWIQDTSRHFKVSNLVIIFRLYQIGAIIHQQYETMWDDEVSRLNSLSRLPVLKSKGGDFYSTHRKRLGYNFSTAVLDDTFNGETSVSEAEDLLGVSGSTFERFAGELGYP